MQGQGLEANRSCLFGFWYQQWRCLEPDSSI